MVGLYDKLDATRMQIRPTIEIAGPKLVIVEDSVFFEYAAESRVPYFDLSLPLIDQLIFLKYFLVPENGNFYVQWMAYIAAATADPECRASLFAPKDLDADQWFSVQPLPTVDTSNVLQSGLEAAMALKNMAKMEEQQK